MSSTSRNAALRSPGRLGRVTAVTVLVTAAAVIAGIVANGPAASPARPAPATPAPPRATAAARANAAPSLAARGRAATGARGTAVPLVLTAADRRHCPATASACVDLTGHFTWLQDDGKVSYGPVQMEPGKPGSQHQTPRGTFIVSWKAGPSYVSSTYREAMPWATFFGTGGDAFHGGSLTSWSHGCVHLTDSNAHYFNEHLPVGAQVVVF